jgi:TRAP-type C4-dicarboxylate transport system permease large subunit
VVTRAVFLNTDNAAIYEFDRTGLFIAFCFLVVGCFLDAIPAIIIVGTILEPLARAVNMDPVHFAMVGIISLAFGLVTPPYGLCLMISCSIGKVRLMYVIKDVIIMLLPMLGVLSLTIVWPDLILFLPKLVSPEFLKARRRRIYAVEQRGARGQRH